MKRAVGLNLALSFLMLILTSAHNRQASVIHTEAFWKSPAKLPNTLLWKISGNGLQKPSYLFGTMHVLCATDAVLSDSLKMVIKACDEVVFEINLDDLLGLLKSFKYMQMNNGSSLSDLLSPADYQKVKSYFEQHKLQLPFTMVERFKPMLISSLIEEDGLGCQATDGMELEIMKMCRKLHKKIGGLETAEYQAGLFDSIPYKYQARDLVNYIDSVEYYRKMTAELADVYKRQDLERIDELTQTGDASVNNYLDLLLYNRNQKWADKLDTMMTRTSLLIAVGAGHLPGQKGLIQKLIQKGYSLSPVNNDMGTGASVARDKK